MALILCVETTSTNCSVALASDNGGFDNEYGIVHCLDLIEDNSDGYSHGERLHIYINEILTRNNITANDLDGIAVSEGPGSYTGLRIGVATVKGLCYALSIPMMAVSTLESLSKQNTSSNVSIAMLDARRMEVYAAVFKGVEQIEPVSAVILDQESFSRFRESGTVTFIGTGITKFEELIKEEQHTYTTSNPTALTMCDLAMEKYKKSDTVDVAYFEPFYLKEFKAG
ncbi:MULTISPECIES: tRNA (adenosine(37)-N6)-threonylcarbamoyltransferase complex dimerization subunit type 1 TsaB [Nonlabens]|uniref:N(6)-L-threonylcarbamoyladenine synthase n=1 Tax=Nonlabens xylanidelens TaxID=191564 RepID=A0A2S6IRR0_9FLAO|nr:tRNA (adenosine(37)-N6)-threonylcarbamoyltransferase complex dimerization subunit type 1 TsaB [Nonlabens xylanidelens]PPK96820.1 tRNA threonylcarbamoyladenosine biosynthesis protein TsaB [Nonlabens xylanidelens]PQJ13522.1 tRNA (adenosine(37)-N6)-threonylcarbamoyltransferase complex dimerization subunit type 1 TsaB [Nonlabens xylanidelens]